MNAAQPMRPHFTITHSVDWDTDSTDVVALDEPKEFGKVRPRRKKGIRFRMFDDDGNLLYRGTMYGSTHTHSAFAPLDWGQWMAGATRLEYYEPGPDGRLGWQVL